VAGKVGEGLSVPSILTPAERKLFIRKPEWAKALLPLCEAMKQAEFETATVADIMGVLQDEPELPSKFYIVDNRTWCHQRRPATISTWRSGLTACPTGLPVS